MKGVNQSVSAEYALPAYFMHRLALAIWVWECSRLSSISTIIYLIKTPILYLWLIKTSLPVST